MKSISKRLLSLALVLMMVVSMVPTVALAAEDAASSTCAAQNVTTGEQYADLNEAISAAEPGQSVRVMADSHDLITVCQDVILDLNGHDLTNVAVSEDVTLSAIDSATDDYEGDFGTLITEGKVAPTVKTTGDVKSYVTVAANGSYSFHRYYASVAAISLKPAEAALGYRAEFRGDETVKNAVVGYGYELWVNDGAHKTYSRTDALEKSSLTLRLKNILVEGNDSLNALGSTAAIGGNAFITLELNGEQVTLCGTEQTTTLRQVVESVNAKAGTYGEAQLEQIRALCTTYAPWMMGWATENIFGAGEGDGDDTGLDVEITVDVTAENNVLTQDATLSYNGITAIVPQGTVLENGTTQLVLTIIEKASSDSDVTEGEGKTLIPLDVHIAGISESNTTPIIICLGQILPKGLNIGNYDLHHVENGKTVPMTRVYTLEELDAHNEFHYDPATGAVTVAMASFSELTLLTNNENQWNGETDTTWYDAEKSTFEIHNADQLAGLGKLVDDGNTFESKTITMIGDINLYGVDGSDNRYNFNPIGFGYAYDKTNGRAFMGTFDGNGNTISGLYQNCWELGADVYTYSTAGGGLFASVSNATIKNLTMDNASIVMECVDMGIVVGYAQGNCTFENIVVKNSALANYQRYTGGVIGEVSNGHHILNNVDVEASTTVGTLWGDFDAAVGGIIGGVWGHDNNDVTGQDGHKVSVEMVNCDVAAKLDVYNDVTSAYQWYSYRRAGMLIGYTNESKTVDGRTEATASFLKTVKCTVQYGDWANYHYCEFNGTTSLGARYPWVRVEAGKQCGAYSNPRYGVPAFTNATLDTDKHTENDGCHIDGDGHNVEIVFNQLYGGGQGCYGGNSHIDNGVTVIGQNGDPVVAATKFTTAGVENILTGSTVTLGDLFQAVDGADIQSAYVYGFVSPVDEKDTVRGTTAVPYADCNWEDLTITFSGTGMAKITISDYYYCEPTTIYVNVLSDVYIATKRTEGNYWYMTSDLGTASTKRYQAVDSGLTTLPESITTAEADKVFTLIDNDDGTYSIQVAGVDGDNYLGWTSGNSGILVSVDEALKLTVDITDGVYNIHFTPSGKERYLSLNSTSGNNYFAWYEGTQKQDLVLIPVVVCEHEWSDWSQTKAPSCADAGEETRTCSKCPAEQTQELAKLPHTEVIDEGKDATCTETGLTEGKHCSVCEEVLVEQEETPLANHSYDNGVCSVCGEKDSDADTGETTNAFVKTSLADIKPTDIVVITMTNSNGTFAMSNDKGTGSAPAAVKVTVTGNQLDDDIAENIKWNIGGSVDNYTIYPNGTTDKWLYCTSTNNGVRVGTNSANTFKIDNTSGYLVHNGTGRYIGVYNSQDWRCYTSVNSNIQNQTLTFYVLGGGSAEGGEGGESGGETGGTTEPVTKEYTFGSYPAGTQYAQGEDHILDDNVTLTINGAHLNTQVRLYAGSNAIFKAANKVITSITVKAGYKADTLNVYASTDEGKTWTLVDAQKTTTTYTYYTFELPEGTTHVKLESVDAQIRIESATLTMLVATEE